MEIASKLVDADWMNKLQIYGEVEPVWKALSLPSNAEDQVCFTAKLAIIPSS